MGKETKARAIILSVSFILILFSFYFDYNLIYGTHIFAAFTEIAIGIISIAYLFKTHDRNTILMIVGMIFIYEAFVIIYFPSWI